uniref:ABM domain-containing protein n=1 Tax=Mycena chlorophos TaxID=658473 RepID=A0ABQ0KUA1_MYCCL|nr:predicted protein [Mycena chlorophos]
MPVNDVTHALYVPLHAKAGEHDHVISFLKNGAELAKGEAETTQWYGIQFDDKDEQFAIFDAFHNEHGREEHLHGPVAAALTEASSRLTGEAVPEIDKTTILSSKSALAKPTIGVVVWLKGKPDQIDNLRSFLGKEAEPIVDEEDFMPLWYAIELDEEHKFGIVEFFETEADRQKHLAGKVRATLFEHAARLLQGPPEINRFKVIAASVHV